MKLYNFLGWTTIVTLLIFGMVSCSSNNSLVTTTSTTTITTTTNLVEYPIVDPHPEGYWNTGSLEEYRSYITENINTEGFIDADALSFIGSFWIFEYYGDALPMGETYGVMYEYHFLMGQGEMVTVAVDPKGVWTENWLNTATGVDPLDDHNLIKTIGNNEKGSYTYNDNIKYYYSDRSLSTICLNVDGYWYRIYGDSAVWTASAEECPLLHKLLDKDTVEEAYDEFAAHVRGTAAE